MTALPIRVPRALAARPVPLHAPHGGSRAIETAAAWLLGILWVLPLFYAFWTAFHAPEYSTRFVLAAPWTLDNFINAWHAAPFARYFFNTVMLVTMVLAAQCAGDFAAYVRALQFQTQCPLRARACS
jgi:sn-glycerol 3-phosphate transport system permease protein